MTLPEPYFTAKILAGKPGMPGTVQNVNSKAKRENWPWRKHAGKGGGREYPITSLPPETRAALAVGKTTTDTVAVVETVDVVDAAALTAMGINPLHPETHKMIRAGRAARKQKDMDDAARRQMKELSLARFNQLPPERQQSGNAKYLLLNAAKAYCLAAGVNDRERIRTAFNLLRRQLKWWPQPAELLKALPRRTAPATNAHPAQAQPSDEDHAAASARFQDILDSLK